VRHVAAGARAADAQPVSPCTVELEFEAVSLEVELQAEMGAQRAAGCAAVKCRRRP
jgi:hypothetical protein